MRLTCTVLSVLPLSIHNRSKIDPLVKVFNLKCGSFPSNANLDCEVTTKYGLSILNHASGIDNLTIENRFVFDLVNIKNLYPVYSGIVTLAIATLELLGKKEVPWMLIQVQTAVIHSGKKSLPRQEKAKQKLFRSVRWTMTCLFSPGLSVLISI